MKLFREIMPYIIVVILVVLVRTFIITPVKVDGTSMLPTLENNQVLLLKKFEHNFKRFDIVAINYKQEKLVKRIIGLPGDHIQYRNNSLYVNGKKIDEPIILETEDFRLEQLGYGAIPEDYYLVLGDNRYGSLDSRVFGLFHKKDLLGVTIFRLWPFNKFGKI